MGSYYSTESNNPEYLTNIKMNDKEIMENINKLFLHNIQNVQYGANNKTSESITDIGELVISNNTESNNLLNGGSKRQKKRFLYSQNLEYSNVSELNNIKTFLADNEYNANMSEFSNTPLSTLTSRNALLHVLNGGNISKLNDFSDEDDEDVPFNPSLLNMLHGGKHQKKEDDSNDKDDDKDDKEKKNKDEDEDEDEDDDEDDDKDDKDDDDDDKDDKDVKEENFDEDTKSGGNNKFSDTSYTTVNTSDINIVPFYSSTSNINENDNNNPFIKNRFN